jgi:hypothetical protein
MFGHALDIGFIDKIFTQQLNSGFWLSNDAFPPGADPGFFVR